LTYRGVNAAVESFFATLKRELDWIHKHTRWSSRTELRAALFDYIEALYNTQRVQRRLDRQSPVEFDITRARDPTVSAKPGQHQSSSAAHHRPRL
jgi:transposase InsO family protein